MSEHSLLHTQRNFLLQSKIIDRGESIIIATSGGMDSIVLLDLLDTLKKEFAFKLAVAHFNHQLRGQESDDDEAFVRSVAKQRSVECYVERANTRAMSEATKRSVQDVARELRYNFFTTLRTSLGYQKIATAHHADDNAETMLFNFFRGAGVNGLSGIPVLRKDISVVRPLAFATREQILQFAQERQLVFREDSSNLHNEYMRNFLRHELIPTIRDRINPNIVGTLQRTSELFEQLEEYLELEAERILPSLQNHETSSEVVIDLSALHNKPIFLQEYLLRHIARRIAIPEIDFSTVQAMLKISHSETGSTLSITKEWMMYRNRSELIMRKVRPFSPFRYTIEPNKEYSFDQFFFSSSNVTAANFSDDPNIAFIDGTRITDNLMLRSWNHGDTFVPLGMHEKKKLSDFFIDEKIPLFEKQSIPILLSDGDIVWICGKRLDDRFKVTPETKSIIKLVYINKEHT